MASIKIHGRVYDLDAPLFGAKAIAQVRNQSERQVFHAAAEGRFTFRKDGRLIVSTPREALEPLIGAEGIARLIVPENSATDRSVAMTEAA
jgi:hypothetical protein